MREPQIVELAKNESTFFYAHRRTALVWFKQYRLMCRSKMSLSERRLTPFLQKNDGGTSDDLLRTASIGRTLCAMRFSHADL